MNWVGGARNRLKVPNERKLQKEYFERKRLGTKVRDQALDQMKAPISKDLLFLSKAAENDYTDRSPRAVPNRVNLDSAVKHPGRDLELPMSPIEKPSTLDLADSLVFSSLNHSFYPPQLNTNTLPNVSTMKLPQVCPVINNSVETYQKREDMLNVSCVSESLFPVTRCSAKACQSSINGRMVSKKYSLDELLDSSQIRENHLIKQEQLTRQRQAPSKTVSKHSNDLLWANLGGMLGRKRPPSVNPDTLHKQAKRPMIKPKKDTGYDFSGWVSRLDKASNNASLVEQIHDKDAMLEIHYTPDEPTKTDLPKAQRVSRKDDKPSWPLLSTLLTENPFSDHHKSSQTVQSKDPKVAVKQVLKSQYDTILNESILGPLKKAQAEPVVKKSKERKLNAFEKMMISFENGQKIDQKDTELSYPKNTVSNIPSEENKPQKYCSTSWKKFVSGDVEELCKKPELPVPKEKKCMNCSAWEELICLDEEVFGLNTCTQELTLSPLDCTEEPLLRQVPDVMAKNFHCQFDSSQDSFISSKSHSGNNIQSQHQVSNDHSLLTNLDKETKLTEMVCKEFATTVCPSISIESVEVTVPAFNNTVEIVSTVEALNNTTSNDPSLHRDSNISKYSISPAKNFAPLCTQTTPSIVCQPTKNQEQQASPTMKCAPSPMDIQSYNTLLESSHTDKKCKNVATQVGCISEELRALKEEVSRLQKELGSAESTIVWQSLMLKIKDI